METVSVTHLVPTLRQLVNVALPPLMHTALAQAAQEFCRESGLVRYTREFDHIEAGSVHALIGSSALNQSGQGSYLTSEIIALLDENGEPLQKGSHYQSLSRDVLRFLVPIAHLTLECTVEPLPHSLTLPKVLCDEYGQAVCYGAAHRLLWQPDSDWHHPTLANEYRQWFIEALRLAKRFQLESGQRQSFANPIRCREFF